MGDDSDDSGILPEMSEEEGRDRVLVVLRGKGKLRTRELEKLVQESGQRCPDSAVRFLMRLRAEGVIKGEVSTVHRGWVWWVE